MLYYYNEAPLEAVLEVTDNNITLKKGSKISLVSKPALKHHLRDFYKWLFIIKNDVDKFGLLTTDVEVSSVFQASNIVLGDVSSGNFWKDEKNIYFDDNTNSENTEEDYKTQKNYLMDFLRNIDVLNELESETGFNIFETLSIVRTEIRHSNVLAWFLNPNETHGLNDYFLKEFIKLVYRNNTSLYKDFQLEDIFLWNYENVEVFREKKLIDILIVENINKFVIVIENKIDSKEHGKQLNNYQKFIEEEYSDYKKMYVYLTKTGEEPSDSSLWGTFSYENILENILDECVKKADSKVKEFISDYQTILRRYIVGDTRIEEICRKIYNNHKKALDLIYQYKPDLTFEVSTYLLEIVKTFEFLKVKTSVKAIVRFSDDFLDGINSRYKDVSGKWVKEKSVILFEFKIHEKNITLSTVVGPTTDSSRNEIINYYEKQGHDVHAKGEKWTTLKSVRIALFDPDDLAENIIDNINKNLDEKLKKHIEFTHKALMDF